MRPYLVELPDQFVFSTTLPVVYRDLNPANHFAADRVLSLAFEAQLRFMRHLGYPVPTNLNGIGLFLMNSQVDYLSEAHHGDRLKIELAVMNLQRKQVDFVFRIAHADSDREFARVKTTNVAFHLERKKSVAIPDDLKEKWLATFPTRPRSTNNTP